MTRKKGEQPEFPIEDPKLPVELDGEGGGDSLFDVDGALAGLLDAVIPGAFGQDLPPGGRYVEQFQEEHQWSEVEFLPEGFTFRDYIMASAISAWEYENAKGDINKYPKNSKTLREFKPVISDKSFSFEKNKLKENI